MTYIYIILWHLYILADFDVTELVYEILDLDLKFLDEVHASSSYMHLEILKLQEIQDMTLL